MSRIFSILQACFVATVRFSIILTVLIAVVFGFSSNQAFAVSAFKLSNINGVNGFTINGIAEDDQLGISVSNAGDINNDGINDLIIGAFNASPNDIIGAGQSYVVFGSTTVGSGAILNLSDLNGINGFAINGIAAFDNSGRSVSNAGDINCDGIDDLIIGAPGGNPNGNQNAGQSYVVFGSTTVGSGGILNLSTLNGTNGFAINGVSLFDQSGFSVSNAGDINGDRIDDLIIGADFGSPNGTLGAGQSYVVFGGTKVGSGGTLDLSTLNGTNGFAINGIVALDRSGVSVSNAGDINDDGIHDLIVGAINAEPNGKSGAGQSYVVFGSTTVGSGGILNLSTLNGTNGFTINGIAASDRLGFSVSNAGDINSDGIGDLIIGAFGASPKGKSTAGQSYVVFGSATVGTGGTLDLSTLNGTNGFAINGIAVRDRAGRSVSNAGDINGDGIDDLIIGAIPTNPKGNSRVGQSYVVFGSATVGRSGTLDLSTLNGTKGFAINGLAGFKNTSISVSDVGDINNDGIGDLIIGASGAKPNGVIDAGQVYVVYGNAAPTLSN